MSTSTEHAADWDAQRETLSAYLDGRLPPAEAEALRRHLETCSRCAQELAELRRVVALLRALPQPALPRAFTLPTPTPAPAQPARRTRLATGWPRVAQWAGGLVAAAGLIIGIAGTVGQIPSAMHGVAGSAGVTSAPNHDQRAPASATANGGMSQPATPAHAVYDGTAAPAQHQTPTVALAPAPTLAPGQTSSTHAGPESPSQEVPALPIAGATLLVAGGVTFAAGRAARRRQR